MTLRKSIVNCVDNSAALRISLLANIRFSRHTFTCAERIEVLKRPKKRNVNESIF